MNLNKIIASAGLCIALGTHAMNTDIDNFINQHRNSPNKLRDLLIDIAKWETPDLDAAKKILDLGVVTADAKDPGNIMEGFYGNPGWTALTTAASYGHTAFVKLLLNYKADIEIKSPWDGRTALIAAALGGHDDTVALLLERGANVNATNCSGNTALMWATEHAEVNTVKLLLAAQADVTLKNADGETALAHAKEALFSQYKKRYHEIAQLLQAAGAQE